MKNKKVDDDKLNKLEDLIDRLGKEALINDPECVVDISRANSENIEKTLEEIKKDIESTPLELIESDIHIEGFLREPELNFEVSGDGLEAYVIIDPYDVKDTGLSKKFIIKKANAAGIKIGFLDSEIEKLIKRIMQKPIKTRALIARGIPPSHGKDAYFIEHYKEKFMNKFSEKEDPSGRVNYREHNIIYYVRAGEKIMTKVPAEKGKNGMDVYGNPIKAQDGKDIKIFPGKNVKVSKDMKEYFSEVDGQVVLNKNKIDVIPVYMVPEDVGLKTGNIRFNGNIIIHGKILDGSIVETTGDLTVEGNIQSAKVLAQNIEVRRGIVMKNKGLVKSNGTITARFMENAIVEAESDIFVEKAVLHSKVKTKGYFKAKGNRGLVTGGSIIALKGIEVNIAGSIFNTKTELYAGIDFEVQDNVIKIKQLIEKYTKYLQRLMAILKNLGIENLDISSLEGKKKETIIRLINTYSTLKKSINTNKKKLEDMENRLYSDSDPFIKVNQELYPGVTIYLKEKCLHVKEKLYNCYLSLDPVSNIIRIKSLKSKGVT